MKLSDIQWEFLRDVAVLIQYAERKKYKLTGGELRRSRAQQQIHVEAGRSKTLDSDHLRALAIDLNIFFDVDSDGDMDYTGAVPNAVEVCRDLGEFWKSLNENNYWGGDWGWDTPHFGRKVT